MIDFPASRDLTTAGIRMTIAKKGPNIGFAGNPAVALCLRAHPRN